MTYPQTAVKEELELWWVAKVDVSVQPDLARLFGVPAVPEAIGVDGNGHVLGRIPGFVEPGAFREALRKLREGATR